MIVEHTCKWMYNNNSILAVLEDVCNERAGNIVHA